MKSITRSLALLSFAALLGQFAVVSAADHPPLKRLEDIQKTAEKFHVHVAPPHFESKPEEIQAAGDKAIKDTEDALLKIAQQDRSKVSFESTIAAYDRTVAPARAVGERINLLQETLPDKAGREAAVAALVKLQAWAISLEYRDDIYQVVKAYADTHPKLSGEQKLLFDETMRTYRRAGLNLPKEKRDEVEQLRKKLSELTTQFSEHVNQARGPLDLTAAQAEGLPESLLTSPGVKQDDSHYRVMINVTWQYQAVAEHAKDPEVRRQAYLIRNNLAREDNVPVMQQIVALRTDIAHRLGYATWADYQIEPRMAKNGKTARDFEEQLVAGLQKKFDAELEELRKLKAAETGKADAKLEAWDVSYYQDKLKRERYSVDAEQLRVYFPYQATLEGMFRIYEKIFGLTFTEVQPPEVWAPGVRLYAVQDAEKGEPMGLFYLDMFPREGKYNHFACFGIFDGETKADGTEIAPIASLVCNFPPPSADKPSLLKHDDVQTLFHEFGHVMHMILGRSKYPGHASFNVEQDFVEAPSQMLENWVWDKAVLDTFAHDYRDPSKTVPAEIIDALKRAREATAGLFYRRQLAFGVLDLELHSLAQTRGDVDVVGITNRELARVTVPPDKNTAFIAYFGHLAGGYDAGYYGYLWSLAIAQDMASVFRASPNGFLDEKIGRRLRKEIYSAAASREAKDSVEAFLGRKESLEPFLEFVGAAEPKNSQK
ncbi:MAG TPA: M3 family metallopeptidase [Opitutaceae bacterium]|nr:M3 family metallopeptidase [Opitutaceae bacterium]